MGTTPSEVAAIGHQEAPVSMSAKVVSPEGIVWTITIRDGADKSAVSRVVQLAKDIEANMVEKGWTGYERPYRRPQPNPNAGEQPNGAAPSSNNGHNGHANGSENSNGKLVNAYIATDGTPVCAIHGTPLQQSNFGGFYCPKPGDGPKGYCTAKYKP